MNIPPAARGLAVTGHSGRTHRWRRWKDHLARRVIGLGGLSVVPAIALILLCLLYIVVPLFVPASTHWQSSAVSSEFEPTFSLVPLVFANPRVGRTEDDITGCYD